MSWIDNPDPHQVIFFLYTYIVRRKGADEDEMRTVAAPSDKEAIIALAQWSSGVWIKRLISVNAPGSGGTS